jgi:hypothetical protein
MIKEFIFLCFLWLHGNEYRCHINLVKTLFLPCFFSFLFKRSISIGNHTINRINTQRIKYHMLDFFSLFCKKKNDKQSFFFLYKSRRWEKINKYYRIFGFSFIRCYRLYWYLLFKTKMTFFFFKPNYAVSNLYSFSFSIRSHYNIRLFEVFYFDLLLYLIRKRVKSLV